tara:strand:+ start:320 stop:913 length:594 start_codon:yes stop_codon:yes gene_type:complete
MKTLKNILLMVPLLFFACGPTVRTVKAPNTNLDMYETYAFLPNSMELENKNNDTKMVSETVLTTVTQQIQEEGLAMDRSNPDLLVLVSTKTGAESYTDTDPIYATYPYYSYPTATNISPYYNNSYYYNYGTVNRVVGYDTDTYNYKEGTLVIDLIDADSKETVWKGVTSDNIYSGNTTEAIADLVADVFDEYPNQDM